MSADIALNFVKIGLFHELLQPFELLRSNYKSYPTSLAPILQVFGECHNTMLLLTKRVLLDQHIKNETAVAFMRDPKNLVVHCSSLSVYHFASIACQFLNVARIPDSLDHVLRLNSMGIPSWIDLLLREYLYTSLFAVKL